MCTDFPEAILLPEHPSSEREDNLGTLRLLGNLNPDPSVISHAFKEGSHSSRCPISGLENGIALKNISPGYSITLMF